VVGASGIGKTQLGVSFANAGRAQEGRRGIIFDMTSRGDSQSHAEYAQRMVGWKLTPADPDVRPDLDAFFPRLAAGGPREDYLHIFQRAGRRVNRRDLDFEGWQDWKSELAAKLETTIAFFYGNLLAGARRVVVDGIEPVERASDSIQLEMFEYVYHQVLRKESEWVARDLFRQKYREQADRVAAHPYDPSQVGCLLLYTSHESMLDQLIERPLEEGDLLANANTILYLGKFREGTRLGRALYVAKHRGSACSEEILPYTIDDGGIRLA
jgi:KaiC/GvpD/RAD55 family RecA-like ATPase